MSLPGTLFPAGGVFEELGVARLDPHGLGGDLDVAGAVPDAQGARVDEARLQALEDGQPKVLATRIQRPRSVLDCARRVLHSRAHVLRHLPALDRKTVEALDGDAVREVPAEFDLVPGGGVHDAQEELLGCERGHVLIALLRCLEGRGGAAQGGGRGLDGDLVRVSAVLRDRAVVVRAAGQVVDGVGRPAGRAAQLVIEQRGGVAASFGGELVAEDGGVDGDRGAVELVQAEGLRHARGPRERHRAVARGRVAAVVVVENLDRGLQPVARPALKVVAARRLRLRAGQSLVRMKEEAPSERQHGEEERRGPRHAL
mmetsp:Transcript_10757/g.27069  ORF Transcript_10757/g.27069 Transcript_10757/m.27069 type:complete len:314 (+) Transcript_10757:876-1817(+)